MAKKEAGMSVTAQIATAGVEELTGEIISKDKHGVLVRAKKPRSSKYADVFVPMNRLGAIYSSEEEEEATVVFYSHQTQYDEVSGTHNGINALGLHEIETEDGTVEISPAFVNVGRQDAEEEEEAPKKKAAAKKKVEEEEEEEEEAPKKKGGKKKVDDDDDWS